MSRRNDLFQAVEPAVFYHDDKEELERALTRLEAIIDAACTEAELYGRLHETIEHFLWGALTIEQYSNRHDELTERISNLQSGKDEVTHE